MMVQLVLIARLPWLDRRIGMDRLTAWHRWVGIALAVSAGAARAALTAGLGRCRISAASSASKP